MNEPERPSIGDFDRRLLTICSEVRQGGIGEAEISEVYQNMEDGIEMTMTITVRREVRHFHPPPAE